MMRITIEVTDGQRPERLDVFLTHSMENASRSKIRQAIDVGAVRVNGKGSKASYLVKPGDTVEIDIPRTPKRPNVAEDIPLDIVYEDDDLLVINKPAGMTVHPGHGTYSGTLVNALLHHCNRLAHEDDAIRPGIVHRIDKNTSGLLVAAKTDRAHRILANQFKNKTTTREYWAVVWGIPDPKSGVIEGNIGRHPRERIMFAIVPTGKPAVTEYETLETFAFASLIKCTLRTGRTHQIRVHCSHIHHPIFGDATYGGRLVVYGGVGAKHHDRVENILAVMPRQALHARTLGFTHPTTGERLNFTAELPDDMKALLTALRQPAAPGQ
jgi:23S rRNA pseudouridine1911/1915/1917 synthase